MSEKKIENAKITSTSLGYEGHGIMTAYVTLEGAGWKSSTRAVVAFCPFRTARVTFTWTLRSGRRCAR